MKGKRHKHVKKTLQFYKVHFGYEPPYSVVIDGTFCKAALEFKVNISDQLQKYLDAETNLCTTKCIKKECEALGSLLYGPLKVLQQFEVIPCKHDKAVSASKCLLKFARKKENNKYIIATQDADVTEKIRDIPGTPLLFLSHKTLMLEAPSATTRQVADDIIAGKIAPSSHQHETLVSLKKEVFGEAPVLKKRKRKGPKGPNPLSCKKKKTKSEKSGQVNSHSDSAKRKRKRHKRKKGVNVIVAANV